MLRSERTKAQNSCAEASGLPATNTTRDGFTASPRFSASVTAKCGLPRKRFSVPVVSIIPCNSLDHAIEIGNDIAYGLSSSLYTRNVNNAFTAMREMETGIFYVNAPTIGAETHLPFGGTKQTGNGHREAAHCRSRFLLGMEVHIRGL